MQTLNEQFNSVFKENYEKQIVLEKKVWKSQLNLNQWSLWTTEYMYYFHIPKCLRS